MAAPAAAVRAMLAAANPSGEGIMFRPTIVLVILLSSSLAVAQTVSTTAHDERELAGPWMVTFSAGNPQMASLGLARSFGPRWRVLAEGGSAMGLIFSGLLQVQHSIGRLGPVRVYASASATLVYLTGVSWGGVGPSGTSWGGGLGVGAEYRWRYGFTLAADLGVLAGDWDEVYETERPFLPQFTLFRVGYAW
jgi:hypothetical protein